VRPNLSVCSGSQSLYLFREKVTAMSSRRLRWVLCLALGAGVAGSAAAFDDPPPGPSGPPAPVDLSKPFHTRTPWRLMATQGPPEEDGGGDLAPGKLSLCLQRGAAGPCLSEPVTVTLAYPGWGPHYLETAKPVYPRGRTAPPLLELVTASQHGGNGSQAIVTQLLKYDPARDAFERIYEHDTGANNNEETRFIGAGPLKGAVISADPTENAPFGYWITVSRFTPARTYAQVLRYRSATRYNDGNPLAVIDSETPNIEQRLGLWKPGSPLPLPAGKPCPNPRLKHSELWCG
jgi:hypothetical protein